MTSIVVTLASTDMTLYDWCNTSIVICLWLTSVVNVALMNIIGVPATVCRNWILYPRPTLPGAGRIIYHVHFSRWRMKSDSKIKFGRSWKKELGCDSEKSSLLQIACTGLQVKKTPEWFSSFALIVIFKHFYNARYDNIYILPFWSFYFYNSHLTNWILTFVNNSSTLIYPTLQRHSPNKLRNLLNYL